MRPLTHVLAVIFGLAAPTALTFWSISDTGPRNKAHYDRVAAERTDTRAVIERLAAGDFAHAGRTIEQTGADGETGFILYRDGGGPEQLALFTIVDGQVVDQRVMTQGTSPD